MYIRTNFIVIKNFNINKKPDLYLIETQGSSSREKRNCSNAIINIRKKLAIR